MAFNWKGTEGILTICGIIIAVIILIVASYLGLRPKKKQEEQTNDNGNDDNSNKKSSDGKTTSIVGKKKPGKNGNKDKKNNGKKLKLNGPKIISNNSSDAKEQNDKITADDDSLAFFKKDSTPPVIPNPNPAPTPTPNPAPDPNNPPPGPDSRLGPGKDIKVEADKKVVVPEINVDLPINDDGPGDVEEGDKPSINIPNDGTRSGMENLTYSNYHDKETDNPDYIADLRLGIALNSTKSLGTDLCVQPEYMSSVNNAEQNYYHSKSHETSELLRQNFRNFILTAPVRNPKNLSDAINLLNTGIKQRYCEDKSDRPLYRQRITNNAGMAGVLLANFIRQNICEQNSFGDTRINAVKKGYIQNTVVPKFMDIIREAFFDTGADGKFIQKPNGCDPKDYHDTLRNFVEGLVYGGLTTQIANLNGNDFKNLKKDIFQSLNDEVDKMVDYFKRNGEDLFASEAKTKLDKCINVLLDRDDNNISRLNSKEKLLSPQSLNDRMSLPSNMIDLSMDPAQHAGMSGPAIQQINVLVKQFQIAVLQIEELNSQLKSYSTSMDYIYHSKLNLETSIADAIAAIIIKDASNLTGANRDAFIAGHFIKIHNDIHSKLKASSNNHFINCSQMLLKVSQILQRNMGGKKNFIKAINTTLNPTKKLKTNLYNLNNKEFLSEVVKISLDDINVGPAVTS